MSVISGDATGLRRPAAVDAAWIGRLVRRCWSAFESRRNEQAAMAQLSAMSDRELRDIGLSRSDIGFIAKGEPAPRRRAS